MSPSLRFLARQMDPMFPPPPAFVPVPPSDQTSMRSLAGRFRYPGLEPGDTPKPVISMRDLWGHAGDHVLSLQFLSWNTWLMRDTFRIADILKVFGAGPQLLICLGLAPLDVATRVIKKLGKGEVCDVLFPPILSVCGVSVNPANDACKLASSLISDLAVTVIEHTGNAVGEILAFLHPSPDVIIDVVMDFLAEQIGVEQFTEDKPDIDTRLPQIADAVFRYDVAALSELWRPEERSALLALGPPVPALIGPADPGPGDWEHLGSGLLVFSTTRPIADGGTHRYATTGVSRPVAGGCDFGRGVDADSWACKGVQRTLVDVGPGTLEIYSTHLYSGGGMPASFNLLFGGEPTEKEIAAIREAQVRELAQFVAETHDPRNVAIITGDFNMGNAQRGTLFGILGGFSDSTGAPLQFDDWFDRPMFKQPRGAAPGGTIDAGHTHRGESDSFAGICAMPDPALVKIAPPLPGDFFCDESVAATADVGERIDYLFVQRPLPEHTFRLDVSRIRRRPFQRPLGPGDSQPFLSDHLGLEVTLFISAP